MWITKVSIKHPVFATMVMIGLMVLGLFSYKSLGLESMPNVELPFGWVEVQYPGASPEQVENDITRPARGRDQHGQRHQDHPQQFVGRPQWRVAGI